MLFRFKVKTGHLSIDVSVGANSGAVKVQFFTPYQPCLLTPCHNFLKEPLKYLQSIAIPDLAWRTVIWHRFIQVIADVPPMRQVHLHLFHEQVNLAHRWYIGYRSEEHTSELQSHSDLVCRLLLEKK